MLPEGRSCQSKVSKRDPRRPVRGTVRPDHPLAGEALPGVYVEDYNGNVLQMTTLDSSSESTSQVS